MNLFLLSSIFTAITNLFISFYVLLKNFNNSTNRAFGGMALSVAIWGICGTAFTKNFYLQYKLLWWQIAYSAIIFTPVFYSHFVFRSLGLQRKILIRVAYLLGIFFLFVNWAYPRYFLGDVRFVFNQLYWHDWIKNKNLIYLFFFVGFYLLLLGYAFLSLIRKYPKSLGLKRNQLRYLILGSCVGWIGAELCFLPDFHIDVYPISNFLIAIYPLMLAYAILRYRLMDIKVAITRAGIFIIVYTLVLGLPFALAIGARSWLIEIFGPGWWIAPLGLMAILATAGPFIYIYIQRKAEERLLREQKRYQDTLKQASIGMTRIRNLKRLLNLITHIVTKTVKISYAAIYLYNEENNEYILQVSRDKGRMSVAKLTSDNPLFAWISVKREPLIYEEVKRQMEDTNDATYVHLEKNMRLLNASVIIPSFLEDRIIGLIVLGDKLSGQIYTPEDLNVFQVLASQAALAIENAQFYEEAKQMQEQIAQAEKMSTIGTMADGLSHQINNRLYALSLIAGDTMDAIKTTDTSQCTPEVKEMIGQINHALERIQANVMQGGEVVQGMLKYTRKGDEKFEAITLDQIIDGTLEMVQYKVKLSDIDLVRDYPKDGPKIKGNLIQLQECFFNFIDNAYDAIVERKTTLNEPNYRGRINFSTSVKGEKLEIVIEDNGMGIKEGNLKKLFTPFFTTKISARRGTGLGLYVIRRIIADIHKGSITHESRYKTGTRFILELPIAK